jgi:hypothetical protein
MGYHFSVRLTGLLIQNPVEDNIFASFYCLLQLAVAVLTELTCFRGVLYLEFDDLGLRV